MKIVEKGEREQGAAIRMQPAPHAPQTHRRTLLPIRRP